MKITRASHHAVRLLTYLAKRGGEWTSEELANKLEIPFNHLAKLVQILARRGFLIAKKGKGGGIKLAMEPKKIDLARVMEAVEGPMILSDCIFSRKNCPFSKGCGLRNCLSEISQRIEKMLSSTSILDLVPSP